MGITFSFLHSTSIHAQELYRDTKQSLGNSNSFGVKLGDLDGDGDLDAAIANPTSFIAGSMIFQQNEIWLNDGVGQFSKKPQQLGSSGNLTLFDIDLDGDLDLIEDGVYAFHGASGSYDKRPIRTWLNDGKANFTLSDDYGFKGITIIFDNKSNNDTHIGAITLESSGNTVKDSTIVRVYSSEDLNYKLWNELVFRNFRGRGIATGDLDNDHYSDLVMFRPESNYILINDKEGGFMKSEQELPGNYHTTSVLIDDLNGDGFADILQSNYHSVPPSEVLIFPVKLYLNDGSGRFSEVSLNYNSQYLTSGVAVGDLDNDGDQDIFINHGNQILGNVQLSEILLNDGYAKFTSVPTLEKLQCTSVALGDLDNDGDLDIFLTCAAVVGSQVSNRVWLNNTIEK